MQYWRFTGLRQNDSWLMPAYMGCDDKGVIQYLSDKAPEGVVEIEEVDGFALPGFQNAHSHAFQYAMAGLAETHEGSEQPDDFWSWREAMYSLALTISPDQMEAIASMLYAEMARHGYTQVAEFHYLHHDVNGKPYSNLAEMGERLVKAAQNAGIKITLVPMFYQMGGFGKPATEGQKRFLSPTLDKYLELFEATQAMTLKYDHASAGLGIHSLRAVTPEDTIGLFKQAPKDLPFHIHISEQLKEIEDSVAFHGKRPVEWLLDNVEMNEMTQLVHATHLVDAEVDGIAKTGAQVVVCPSTEGNLGDGLFPLKAFQEKGGNWCIGTDSHIGLNPFEELRILDYGQRLNSHKRNTFWSTQQGDAGAFGLEKATVCGRIAMGNKNATYFAVGEPMDAVVINGSLPLLASTSEKYLLSSILYTCDVSSILGTIVNGTWIAQNGKHHNQSRILNKFSETIKQLKNR